MISLWRIAVDTTTYRADDLSGKGAFIAGGRWNEKGTPVVYTSNSIALACLESLVHLGSASLPLNRYLVRIDVQDAVWNSRQALPGVPPGWDAIPPSRISVQIGESWLRSRSTALLEVPSVVVPEDTNVLINPLHGDWKTFHATKLRQWTYDARF
ncbi:MAG: RES domain-containing protein [Betaproteobacteria bacterium]|nr:RES domain-containing protein [Betaproteobacteria bacterium]